MSCLELTELYKRVTNIKEPKVAYFDVNSFDKETRKWSKISNRAVFDNDAQRWKRNTMFRDDLNKWEQIQVNTESLINAITFDVDEPNLFMYPDDIAPYTVTRNKADDKYHVNYMLKTPFYAKSDKQKRVLNNEIRPQIKRLSLSIGADGRYQNITTKNPFNERLFNATATGQTIPDVWYLLNQFTGELKKLEIFDKEATADNKYLSPAFKELMHSLIDHSKQNIRLLTVGKDKTQFKANMHLYAAQIENISINQNEVDEITKDVIARAIFLANDFVSLQKYRSKKAHSIRYGNQVEENQIKIKEAIYHLASRDIKPTMKAISLLVDLSLSSLKTNYNLFIKNVKQDLQLCK